MSPLPRFRIFWRPYLRAILLWFVIALIIVVGILCGVDEKIIGLAVAVFGLLTHAFTSLLALIAVVPVVGPLAVKILTLPLLWVLNGIGYLLTVLAIKRGYKKEVLNYRILTIVFLFGIVCGYIVGKLL